MGLWDLASVPAGPQVGAAAAACDQTRLQRTSSNHTASPIHKGLMLTVGGSDPAPKGPTVPLKAVVRLLWEQESALRGGPGLKCGGRGEGAQRGRETGEPGQGFGCYGFGQRALV